MLVCGGRDYTNRERIYAELDRLHALRPIGVLIHGCARGADAIAAKWAFEHGISVNPFPADWSTHGKKAGPMRNEKMLAEGKPDVVFAFPGGKGTSDMIGRAIAYQWSDAMYTHPRVVVIFSEKLDSTSPGEGAPAPEQTGAPMSSVGPSAPGSPTPHPWRK